MNRANMIRAKTVLDSALGRKLISREVYWTYLKTAFKMYCATLA